MNRKVEPPAVPSTRRNGPDPTTGWPGVGLVRRSSSSAFSETFFQMCSGTIGIGSSGSTALGFFSFSTTVCASGAVTVVTLLR